MTALSSVRHRRSRSSVTAEVPSRAELLPLVEAAAGVADHGALRPWRIIELRGDSRARLGKAMAEASGASGKDAAKLAAKPLRAELLLAIVVVVRPSFKVPDWEQETVASGVAHVLSLLLDEAGWGVMWRTGPVTRSEPVRKMHHLADNERLLGWLYVGGVEDRKKSGSKSTINPKDFLTAL